MIGRSRAAALALVLVIGAAKAAGPGAVTPSESGAPLAANRTLVLVIEASASGFTLVDLHVADGAPKVRRGLLETGSTDDVAFVLRNSDDAMLASGMVRVPWTLHADEPDAVTGEWRGGAIRREVAVFALRLPLFESAAFVTFHAAVPAPATAASAPMTSVPELGRVSLPVPLP